MFEMSPAKADSRGCRKAARVRAIVARKAQEDYLTQSAMEGRTCTSDRCEFTDVLKDEHPLDHMLLAAQEQERSRIARELHDDVGQRLALLGMRIDGLKSAQSEDDMRKGLADLKRVLLDVYQSVRTISHSLHSPALDYLGLDLAVMKLCREFSETNAIAVECICDEIPFKLKKDTALCLFRVTQEALQNVVKHSGATAARVTLSVEANAVKVRVQDFGIGFCPERTLGGLGLTSIRERVRIIGGSLRISSRPGAGTVVEISSTVHP